MKLNKKAEVFLPMLLVFQVPAYLIAGAMIWHIPSWQEAKKNGTTAQYQAQEMWPQQLFDKLPGGEPGRLNQPITPAGRNGGNFVGGNSNP